MSESPAPPRWRLLVLTPFPPRLDGLHGGARVIAQLVANLAARHEVALLCLRAPDEPTVDKVLRSRCALTEEIRRAGTGGTFRERASLFAGHVHGLLSGTPLWSRAVAEPHYSARVRALADTWSPDLVHINYQVMAQYLPMLESCRAPRLLVVPEPGADAAHDRLCLARGPMRILRYLDFRAWQRFERGVLNEVEAVAVFTERDRLALLRLACSARVERVPVGICCPPAPLDPIGDQPPCLLFVGSFIHPPNVDAALRLTETILPRVSARFPHVVVYLVGDRPPRRVRGLAGPNVRVTGRVPDVTPYLDRAAVVVAPLRRGGGLRVKVLEALAAGKALVASPVALEGIEVVDGEHVLIADSDRRFADAIVELLADVDRRARLAAGARAWANANLGWDRAITAHESLYRRLIGFP